MRAAVLLGYVTAKCIADLIIYAIASPLKISGPRCLLLANRLPLQVQRGGPGQHRPPVRPNTFLRQHGKIFDSGVRSVRVHREPPASCGHLHGGAAAARVQLQQQHGVGRGRVLM